ncbi:hypothetical protein [Cellulomonas chengniuliangii]|uniref:DUF4178 domain-containing protein n=1 Tax=Cellulomonas chengniuliangii TaxID=2968084 RepID=A0ABY5L2I1_9CELL|nr:hypothetical protein [Cellulomonas chengniuliangii]MCC2307104.1 hypothetical protein [Cellulomonas chengniuliangii]MCC2316487.1 hypothetical protein [Cellulomonas chengniuliangii]UUI76098.1 hypothetical protein NP064_04105 [Cellulomonas chengniuliangii]
MSGTHAGHGVITDAHTYAAEVRRHLVGLTPEQVDDLTDGLEADLGEALVDAPGTDDLVGRFGQPSAYAAELRAAAGMPDGAAAPERRRGFWRWVTLPVRAAYEACVEGLDVLRSQPWWPPVGELLTVLLPVAWVLRGWLAYQLVAALAGVYATGPRLSWAPFSNPALFVAMLAAILVSVQWGRGLWLPTGRLRRLPRLTTVVALVAALPIMGTLASHDVEYRYSTVVEYVDKAAPVADGVVVGGMAVSNLYVYDAEGNPLDGVQIYDDRGRPVETIQADSYGRYDGWSLYGVDERWQFTSVEDEDGRTRWNVYPLVGAPMSDFDEWDAEGRPSPSPGATMRTPPRPFAKAPAVPGRAQAPEAAPSAGPADPADPASPAPTGPSAEPEAPAVEGAEAAQ